MPTASVARMPPSTPHNTVRPSTPSPKRPIVRDVTTGDTTAVQTPVSSRASRSPTTNRVANIVAMTPIRRGIPVRGVVAILHRVSPALGAADCAIAASRRASACRAWAMVRARASSDSVRTAAASSPTAAAISASPSSTASAAAPDASPYTGFDGSPPSAAISAARAATRTSTAGGSGVPPERRR